MGADKNLQIDSTHCRAICDEIGERLRVILDREMTALPPRLQVLMLRLAAQDLAGSPSIVPSLGPAENITGSIPLLGWSDVFGRRLVERGQGPGAGVMFSIPPPSALPTLSQRTQRDVLQDGLSLTPARPLVRVGFAGCHGLSIPASAWMSRAT
jgi:hypothetical protein